MNPRRIAILTPFVVLALMAAMEPSWMQEFRQAERHYQELIKTALDAPGPLLSD